jgi:uncharacterized protein YvpB
MTRILKDFPKFYRSQNDNYHNPGGSCNVTSVAMCLAYHGLATLDNKQLEDELYEYVLNNGRSRHSGHDLKWAAETFPVLAKAPFRITDTYTENGTFNDIKKAIADGNPCIVHGYFTRSGHILCIYGYSDFGVNIADPYGEWHSWGYDTYASGIYELSWGALATLCSPESTHDPKHIFLHTVSKHALTKKR